MLHHQLYWGATDDDLLRELQTGYKGPIVSGADLDVFARVPGEGPAVRLLYRDPRHLSRSQDVDELAQACRTEIEQLHRFFEQWFTGRLPREDAELKRFSAVIADSFEMITPDGAAVSRADLMKRIPEAHGKYADEAFRIEIKNVAVRPLADELFLATYEEWQEHKEQRRGRRSSAVFRRKTETPNGVEWLHLHEVWLPDANPES